MKKLAIASFLLAGILGANAQTVRVVGGNVTTASIGNNNNGVNIGFNSGNINPSNTGASNIFIGYSSGLNNTIGSDNSFVGSMAGYSNVSGKENAFFGENAGYFNLSGNRNIFSGVNAGNKNTTGNYNCAYGYMAGYTNTIGSNNTCIGFQAGVYNIGTPIGGFNGGGNTFIGSGAGYNNTSGNYNVFIGNGAGGSVTTDSNKLFIANSGTDTPLIWGDFAASQLKMNGKVGIGGVTNLSFPATSVYSAYNLFVKGGIASDEVRVALNSTWADYVFAKDYKLQPLQEVEKFIYTNGHLPNVPSAAQVKEDGINVAEMARIQQEKIEELTLYIIEQNKRIEALEAKMNTK